MPKQDIANKLAHASMELERSKLLAYFQEQVKIHGAETVVESIMYSVSLSYSANVLTLNLSDSPTVLQYLLDIMHTERFISFIQYTAFGVGKTRETEALNWYIDHLSKGLKWCEEVLNRLGSSEPESEYWLKRKESLNASIKIFKGLLPHVGNTKPMDQLFFGALKPRNEALASDATLCHKNGVNFS
jgi:hypothetical protein